MVVFGEIGLSGEVRAVGQEEARLKEAAKLGFGEALIPRRLRASGRGGVAEGLLIREIGHLQDLLPLFGDGDLKKADRHG
jgi:DNA repair protein RadA/Sms